MNRKPCRDPFDDEEFMRVRPVDALCERMDWLRDQQIMLSVGTQGVIRGQQDVQLKLDAVSGKIEKQLDGVRSESASQKDMNWLKAGVFLLLAWRVGEAVLATAPAQALMASL